MSTREERIKVFNDTMDWIRSDEELLDSVMKARKTEKVYFEDDYPAFQTIESPDMQVSVTKERSFEAAMRLHAEHPTRKIAVMNFANAFHPGGGVEYGAGAQEECLCRTSTLYPLLNFDGMKNTFYKHHALLGTDRASDSLIYTKGVIICKTDEDLPRRMRKKDWVTVDVITIAAPDLRPKSNVYAKLSEGGLCMKDAELFGYHVKRAIHILTCAAAEGADTLVLGAFGCGAFQNDPEVVAEAYREALQIFPKAFKKVVFAVYCKDTETANYHAFKNTLER